MAVQNILVALYGHYEPTGAYSFEFRPTGQSSIAEIFMLLPPESVSVNEPQRSELIPTIGGGFLADFGSDFKEITIEGTIHFFYAGVNRAVRGATRPSFGKQSSEATATRDDLLDGFTEFIKLRFMLSRFRDYTLTANGKLKFPPLPSNWQSISDVTALRIWVNRQVESGEGALADQLELIFHDYDYDEHWKVKIENFSMSRSKDDPWSVQYSISMMGYQKDTDKRSSLVFQRPTIKIIPAQEKVKKVMNLAGGVHEATKTDVVVATTPAGQIYVPTTTSRNVDSLQSTINVPTLPS